MHQYCLYLSWAGWPPEVWAAWAQFAAACIVGFFAIWVPARIARNADRRLSEADRLRARSFVLACEQDYRDIIENLSVNEFLNPAGDNVHAHDAWVRCFDYPERVDRRLGVLHEAGPAATHLQSAFAELIEVKNYWNRHRGKVAEVGKDMSAVDRDYNERLHASLRHFKAAMTEIDKLLDRPPH